MGGGGHWEAGGGLTRTRASYVIGQGSRSGFSGWSKLEVKVNLGELSGTDGVLAVWSLSLQKLGFGFQGWLLQVVGQRSLLFMVWLMSCNIFSLSYPLFIIVSRS